tara:strand:+ start:730 stop:954 length:225 start_codon:yes stop_codon:yes gene_type:complete
MKTFYTIVYHVDRKRWGYDREPGLELFETREEAGMWALHQGMELRHEIGGVEAFTIEEATLQTEPYYPEGDCDE